MINFVETGFDVGLEYPPVIGGLRCQVMDLGDRVMRAPVRPEPLPEDIRFQILYRLFFRSFSKSSIEQPSTPGAPLFALTLSHASHTSRFEISNGLTDDFGSSTQLLPDDLRLIERTNYE
jgi:hypothetical protein